MLWLLCMCFVFHFQTSHSLENGLARTPPMGWLSWTRFLCEVDCNRHPGSCINEQLYMDMADRMAHDGYLEAGYNFVNVDDCWMSMQRDAQDRLQGNSSRFPSGMKHLVDYVHSKGLKFGIYEDYGNYTCGGYPGSMQHLETDAKTFAEWGVDMLKLDGCWSYPAQMNTGYPAMGHFLNATGRPIIYSCSWPDYIRYELQTEPDYIKVANHCNMWRNYIDISIHWWSILRIIDYYDAHQEELARAQKPGAWNDPDMIIVGNPEITEDQSRVQMSLWATYSAPLLMSNDLRDIKPSLRDILQNHGVIAVNQDPLGKMGKLVYNDTVSQIGIYNKWILPAGGQDGTVYSLAIVFFNRNSFKQNISFPTATHIGLTEPCGYDVVELWTGQTIGVVRPQDSVTFSVNATGAIMLRATVRRGSPFQGGNDSASCLCSGTLYSIATGTVFLILTYMYFASL